MIKISTVNGIKNSYTAAKIESAFSDIDESEFLISSIDKSYTRTLFGIKNISSSSIFSEKFGKIYTIKIEESKVWEHIQFIRFLTYFRTLTSILKDVK